MNANELADELQAVLFACGKERPFLEHAKMLLQQQAEIEALKSRELTDEEIIYLINKHIDYVPDEDTGMKVVGVMDFAKAILRKAQEK